MKPGDWYGHKEHAHAMYCIMCIANQAATRPGWPVTVVYQDRSGNVWARPMDEFLERCERLTL